jgi:hypothetical protein
MDFFEEHHNTLDEDFCKHVIEKFENDSNCFPGETGEGVNKEIKDSTDLCFYGDTNWEKEDKIFYDSLSKYTTPYIQKYYNDRIWNANVQSYDTGYQIQRTTPEQTGYVWHHDSLSSLNRNNEVSARIITFLWYLNTTVDGSGTTEFYDGTHVTPEAGKLILFPATWTYSHRGHPPTEGLKYICTGWIWQIQTLSR